jgi:hypothetical protein
MLAVALLAVLAPTSSADVTISGTRLSSRTAPDGLVADGSTSLGHALRLRSTRTLSAVIVLPSRASAVEVRVRGVSCGGSPLLRIDLDGKHVGTRRVSARGYRIVGVARAIAAGRHRLGVALVGARRTAACRRAVIVDRLAVVLVPEDRNLAAPAPVASSVGAGVVAPTTPSRAASPAVPQGLETETDPAAMQEDASAPEPTPADSIDVSSAPDSATDARPPLVWAPPVLTNPTTLAVGQGDRSYTLDTTKDYIIDLGGVPHVGALRITGGRNVVMVGGTIALPALSSQPTALNIKNSVGIVHVEGVEFDGTSGHQADAIQIQAPDAIVQIENVRADGLLGAYDANHTDVIQPWGGIELLRVDRLTADSNYQGIFTRPDQGPIGAVDLRHVDLTFNDSAATASGGYLLWMTTGCDMAPTSLSDIHIQPRSGKSIGAAVWPTTSDANCPVHVAEGRATWPTLPVTGAVVEGRPDGGSFVPAGSAGPGYVSPGYSG